MPFTMMSKPVFRRNNKKPRPKGGSSPFAALGQQAAGSGGGPQQGGANAFGFNQNFNDAAQVYTTFAQPQIDQAAYNANSAQRDDRYRQQGYANQAYDARQDNYYGQRNIELDQAGNRVDRAAAQRQMGYYDNQYDVDRRRYESDMGYQAGRQQFANGRYDIAGRDLGLDDRVYDFAGQRYGLQGQTHQSVLAQLGNQAAMAQRNAFEGNRDAGSKATAAGAFTSAGHGWDREDIAQALGFKLTDIGEQTKQENVNREQQGVDYGLAGVNHDRDKLDYERAGIDYMSETSDIAHTRNNLGFDLEAAGLTKDEQKARLQDRIQTLDLQAQKYGLSSQQLQQRLSSTLRDLNLDGQISTGQLADMLNSADNSRRQIALNILQQAMGAAQNMPNRTPQFRPIW